jgi:hypothetical protein
MYNNDTQHNNKCDNQRNTMLSVAIETNIPSVVKVNVIRLNVGAPNALPCQQC